MIIIVDAHLQSIYVLFERRWGAIRTRRFGEPTNVLGSPWRCPGQPPHVSFSPRWTPLPTITQWCGADSGERTAQAQCRSGYSTRCSPPLPCSFLLIDPSPFLILEPTTAQSSSCRSLTESSPSRNIFSRIASASASGNGTGGFPAARWWNFFFSSCSGGEEGPMMVGGKQNFPYSAPYESYRRFRWRYLRRVYSASVSIFAHLPYKGNAYVQGSIK